MATGKIQKYIPERKFGFIRGDDGSRQDIFFHHSQLLFFEEPQFGMRVCYELTADPTGRPRATNVRLGEG
ncbi:cold shock domain-containing protein [Bradyrhizobium sp. Ai1a-2]|uniref:cold-shock protein n=1 Tax=Bradyrhizobium sp. Ai1a-2 TaxID=196490 RepID=UPI0004060B09|nr:cold shock domain-containing protein [Bradyrhizobium sp. Ai1a-2]